LSEADVGEKVSVIRVDLAKRDIKAMIPGRSNRHVMTEPSTNSATARYWLKFVRAA
jgi:hypothetical protein